MKYIWFFRLIDTGSGDTEWMQYVVAESVEDAKAQMRKLSMPTSNRPANYVGYGYDICPLRQPEISHDPTA